MRIREDDARVTFKNTFRWGHSVTNPNPAWSEATYPRLVGDYGYIRDVSITQFRKRLADGEVFNNPLHLVRTNCFTDFTGVYLYKMESSGGQYGESFGDLRGYGWGTGPHTALGLSGQAQSRAGLEELVERAKERVATETLARKGKSDYAGATFAGELRETLAYLRNPFATGMKLAASIERKLSRNLGQPWKPGLLAKTYDLRPSGSIPRELSSMALEYMYGLRPLVREVEEILERLRDGFNKHSPREQCGASEHIVKTVSWADPNWVQSGISFTANVSAVISVDVKAGALYHFAHSLDTVNRGWGIRLTDIPYTAWALFPSSFVVDWFWGVGSFIKAITPIAGLVTDAEWTVEHKSIAQVAYATNWSLASDKAWQAKTPGNQPTYFTLKEIRRSPAQLMPTITRTRVSEGTKDLVAGQAAGLLALFTQKLDPLMREFGPVLARGRR